MVGAISVRCKPGNGITLQPLGASSECAINASVSLSGDFGATPPSISSVLIDDADDADAVFGAGDVFTLTFAAATYRAGFAIDAVISHGDITRLFTFTPLSSANVRGMRRAAEREGGKGRR